MRVVIAVDSLKGSITATDAARALRHGWLSVRPGDDLILRPMADGGEGTLDAFATGIPAAQRMPVTVRGPHGRDVGASWLLLPDGTGVVELASTSGIELLGDERRGWDADTSGFGQAIAAALDHGALRLVLGVGSSASTDAGLGMLSALGARFLDAAGAPVRAGARGLADLAAIDLAGLRPPPAGGVVVLSDVTNPLTGIHGAAHVFGPQKGLDELDVVDAALARTATFFTVDPATPGAGAAGGTGFGLLAWGARLVPGASEVASLVGLTDALGGADLVITGEGSYDGQSAAGKVPAFVAALADAAGVSSALVAGRITPDADIAAFTAAVSLTDLAGSAAASLADPARWLTAAAASLAADR